LVTKSKLIKIIERNAMRQSTRPSSVSVALNQFNSQLSKKDEVLDNKSLDFTVKLATTLEEREEVFSLAYQIYLEKGYITENGEKWLTSKYDAHSDSAILIVQDRNKKIVGSVTLIFDSPESLPAATIFSQELNMLRSNNEKIVEISRLVIDPSYRNAKEILILLFNYLYIYSYYVKNYTCLAIEVNPRHKDYYRSLLLFEVIGNEKPCPMVQNAPAVLLHLPLHIGESEIQKYISNPNKTKTRSLYPFFFKPEYENLVISYLKNQLKPITKEEKSYFGLNDKLLKEDIVLV